MTNKPTKKAQKFEELTREARTVDLTAAEPMDFVGLSFVGRAFDYML
jgi:hypothetical protein